MPIIFKNLLIKIATCGGLGNFHLAPGTLTSLIAALIGYIININFGFEYTFYLLLLLLPIGWYASEYYSKLYNKKDPKEIVIDEFIGQLIVSVVANKSILLHVIGFILFRYFDIAKIGLIKRVESLPGGYGILMDDIIAALYSIVLLLTLKIFIIGY